MYQQIFDWIDSLSLDTIPEETVAFCFNLYDGCDNLNWSMELIGADSYDPVDSDWACGEVTDFDSRVKEFKWTQQTTWDVVLSQLVGVLSEYLEKGKYAHVLKAKAAVAVGFTDGDLEILFTK